MSRTYTHAGVSKLDGQFKVRFANDSLRTKILIKNGHTDIDIIELKHPMSKEDAVSYLLDIDFATRDGVTNQAVKEALLAEIEKRTPAAPKTPKQPKAVKAPKKTKPTMEGIEAKARAKKTKTVETPETVVTREEVEAQLDDLENAPY